MKRLGIITFHTVVNYGGVLQTVALYSFIKSLGFDVKLIDYHNDIFDKQSDPCARYGNIIKDTLRILFFARKKEKLCKAFRDFVESKTTLSERYDATTIAKANDNFDIFVTGSDQVFNLDITGNDKNFFLSFVSNGKTKMSYAASFGGYSIEQAIDYLTSFDQLSVREGKSAIELSAYKLEASTHIDPTFLVEQNYWKALCEKPKENDYVLLYTLGHGAYVEKLIAAAKQYASENGKKLLYINNGYKLFASGITYKRRISPQQFVGLFANASSVYTNSFHGTAFSIIFQKEFYVDRNLTNGKGERINNLFQVLNIPDRQYDSVSMVNGIDWKLVRQNIIAERNRSEDYLKSQL